MNLRAGRKAPKHPGRLAVEFLSPSRGLFLGSMPFSLCCAQSWDVFATVHFCLHVLASQAPAGIFEDSFCWNSSMACHCLSGFCASTLLEASHVNPTYGHHSHCQRKRSFISFFDDGDDDRLALCSVVSPCGGAINVTHCWSMQFSCDYFLKLASLTEVTLLRAMLPSLAGPIFTDSGEIVFLAICPALSPGLQRRRLPAKKSLGQCFCCFLLRLQGCFCWIEHFFFL